MIKAFVRRGSNRIDGSIEADFNERFSPAVLCSLPTLATGRLNGGRAEGASSWRMGELRIASIEPSFLPLVCRHYHSLGWPFKWLQARRSFASNGRLNLRGSSARSNRPVHRLRPSGHSGHEHHLVSTRQNPVRCLTELFVQKSTLLGRLRTGDETMVRTGELGPIGASILPFIQTKVYS